MLATDIIEVDPVALKERSRERLKALYNPYQYIRDDLVEMVTPFSRDEIKEILGHDPYLLNFALNHWEFAHGVDTLETYPWNVVIPISDLCNASCTFCNSWLRGRKLLEMRELDNFQEVLPYAAMIGLEGHGEPLIHPKFRQIVTKLAELIDPRCRSYIITNAYHLSEFTDDLVAAGVGVYNISLNAASSETHQKVMDLGADGFERAITAIRRVVELRDAGQSRNPIAINVSLVVTADNVHEAADFVRLCNDLRVDLVNLRTLLPAPQYIDGLNYHLLPAYLAPEIHRHIQDTKAAIAESKVAVAAEPDSWLQPVFPEKLQAQYDAAPPKEYTRSEAKSMFRKTRGGDISKLHAVTTRGEKRDDNNGQINYDQTHRKDREAWFQCWDLYAILHMNDFYYFLRPCCYMEHTPGHEWIKYDGSYPFMSAWNSPAMVTLRRSLREGPLFAMCTLCPSQPQYDAVKRKVLAAAAPPEPQVEDPPPPRAASGWIRHLTGRLGAR